MTLDEAFAKLPTFATERLNVRPLVLSDAEDIFEFKSDAMVREKYGTEPHASLDQTTRWVEDRVDGYRKRDSMFWVFNLKSEPKVIGSCCYWHLDEESRCAEIGYELNRMYWHQGFTSEALQPVLAFGFEGMGLNRIEACPLVDNLPSNRLLVKFGFRYEGTLRQRVQFRGRFVDQLYYSLLKGELKPAGVNSP
jgi:[ribosomal protein S5]-alanine N-acetyltransferase